MYYVYLYIIELFVYIIYRLDKQKPAIDTISITMTMIIITHNPVDDRSQWSPNQISCVWI